MMSLYDGICMIGNGGHSHALRGVLESFCSYSITAGGRLEITRTIEDSRALNDSDWIEIAKHNLILVGVGQIHSSLERRAIVHKLGQLYARNSLMTLISPQAFVGQDVEFIGSGCQIMHRAVVNTGASIGSNTILNTGSIIEHDSYIGDFCHIATGAVIGGDAEIGSDVFVGANAVVLSQVKVCSNTTIGAGSVVVNNIKEPGGIYIGNPAKFLRHKA